MAPTETRENAEAKSFAKALTQWRLSRSWTQDELAEHSGVSKSTISLAERAFHNQPPKPVTMSKLAAAFGITIEELQQLPNPAARETIRSLVAQASKAEEPGADVVKIRASQYCREGMNFLSLPKNWPFGTAGENAPLSFMVVEDQAMLGSMRAGDIAVLAPVKSKSPGIYLVADATAPSEPMGFRRVTPLPGNQLRITSDNERYSCADGIFSSKEISLLAKVTSIISCQPVE